MNAEASLVPGAGTVKLALFPLQTVLFPGGLLGLKIFEARYLDLLGHCLRSGDGFGVIALREGDELRHKDAQVQLEPVGVLAEIIEVDSPHSGVLQVSCRGTRRFMTHTLAQQPDGLWVAQVSHLADDEASAVDPPFDPTVQALRNAIDALKAQHAEPFLPPLRFDDAGWVANRWCEILPISLAAKQKLMALEDAVVRLRLVTDYLRTKGVVS